MKTTCKFLLLLCMAAMLLGACTKDEPSTDPDEPGNGKPYEPFTKKTFATSKDVLDFLPAGVYQIEYDKKTYCLAKGTDGSYFPSIVVNEHDAEPDWQVRFIDRFYNFIYAEKQWWRQETHNFPQNLWEVSVTPTMFVAKVSLLSFISSKYCEMEPNSVSDETLAGVAVKHYVYESTTAILNTRAEYWITSTGVCLKNKTTSTYIGIDTPPIISEISATAVDFKVTDMHSIMPKLPALQGATTVPGFHSMPIATYTKHDTEWLSNLHSGPYNQWVKKYTGSGSIKYMTVWYNVKDNRPDEFVSVEVNLSGAEHQDILNYINTVKTITDMTETSFVDQIISGIRLFSWEGGNDCMSVPGDCEHKLGEVGHGIRYEVFSGTATGNYVIRIRLWDVGHV